MIDMSAKLCEILNPNLVTLVPALRGIHSFHRWVKLHFKHWIVMVADNGKVVISQHFSAVGSNDCLIKIEMIESEII